MNKDKNGTQFDLDNQNGISRLQFINNTIKQMTENFSKNPPLFNFNSYEQDDEAHLACSNNSLDVVYFLEHTGYQWQWSHFKIILDNDNAIALSMVTQRLFHQSKHHTLEDNHFLFLTIALRYNAMDCFEWLKSLQPLTPIQWVIVAQIAVLSKKICNNTLQYILQHLQPFATKDKTGEVETLLFYMLKSEKPLVSFEAVFAILHPYIGSHLLETLEQIGRYGREDVLIAFMNQFVVSKQIAFYSSISFIRNKWDLGLIHMLQKVDPSAQKMRQLIESSMHHQNNNAVFLVAEHLSDQTLEHIQKQLTQPNSSFDTLVSQRQRKRLMKELKDEEEDAKETGRRKL